MQLTITAYSTALFSTWYFVEELGILFDCGDGFISAMLQKSRKAKHVFISHADRDHVTGLLQFNQLNARANFPIVHYPKDSGSFSALREFAVKFDPHVKAAMWKPVTAGEKIWIRKDMYVQAVRNNHVTAPPEVIKSVGYKLVQVKWKLHQQYVSLPGEEIRKVIASLGKENTHTLQETILLAYSGDTPCENFEHWQGAEVLIHEATFLAKGEDEKIESHGNKHSFLEDVIKAVAASSIKQLVLGHFSSRYSPGEIDEHIKTFCKQYKLTIPVFRILPGEVCSDILHSEMIYSGKTS